MYVRSRIENSIYLSREQTIHVIEIRTVKVSLISRIRDFSREFTFGTSEFRSAISSFNRALIKISNRSNTRDSYEERFRCNGSHADK